MGGANLRRIEELVLLGSFQSAVSLNLVQTSCCQRSNRLRSVRRRNRKEKRNERKYRTIALICRESSEENVSCCQTFDGARVCVCLCVCVCVENNYGYLVDLHRDCFLVSAPTRASLFGVYSVYPFCLSGHISARFVDELWTSCQSQVDGVLFVSMNACVHVCLALYLRPAAHVFHFFFLLNFPSLKEQVVTLWDLNYARPFVTLNFVFWRLGWNCFCFLVRRFDATPARFMTQRGFASKQRVADWLCIELMLMFLARIVNPPRPGRLREWRQLIDATVSRPPDYFIVLLSCFCIGHRHLSPTVRSQLPSSLLPFSRSKPSGASLGKV